MPLLTYLKLQALIASTDNALGKKLEGGKLHKAGKNVKKKMGETKVGKWVKKGYDKLKNNKHGGRLIKGLKFGGKFAVKCKTSYSCP